MESESELNDIASCIISKMNNWITHFQFIDSTRIYTVTDNYRDDGFKKRILVRHFLDYLIFFLYLYNECISKTEWFWIGFGLVLDPRLFRYISHLTSFYSPYICHIPIKVYGIYVGNKWKNYRYQNQSKTNGKPFKEWYLNGI